MKNQSIFEIAKQFIDNWNNASDAQREAVEKIGEILKKYLPFKKDQNKLWKLIIKLEISENARSAIDAIIKNHMPSETVRDQFWNVLLLYQNARIAWKENYTQIPKETGYSAAQLCDIYNLGEMSKEELEQDIKKDGFKFVLKLLNALYGHLTKEQREPKIIEFFEFIGWDNNSEKRKQEAIYGKFVANA